MSTPIPLEVPAGIQRDGTLLDAKAWRDGQWIRFHRGRPQKMGGYRASSTILTAIPRALHVQWGVSLGYVHVFSDDKVERLTINAAGVTSSVSDRTPSGFTTDTANNWQCGVLYDTTGAAQAMVAHCTANLGDLGDGTSRPIYYGDVTATAALTTTGRSTDGGIVIVQPFVMAYGSNGAVAWSDANKPATWAGGASGSANVTGQKIVRGLPFRSRRALLWSLDTLLAATYQTSGASFAFEEVSNQISVLSSNGIVELYGRYYWPGNGQFFVFDGVVRELPNPFNRDYFFENMNYDRRQCVWGMPFPDRGEIWWFYPHGAGQQECNRAVIYNVFEECWYDVQLARSAGYPARVFRYPLMTDSSNPSTLWQHEYGTDAYDSSSVSTGAIQAYIETPVISRPAGAGSDSWTEVDRIEPDITQTGNVTLTVSGRKYARSSAESDTYTIASTDEKVDLREQRRHMQLKFESNVAGGDMRIGRPLLYAMEGDGRQ